MKKKLLLQYATLIARMGVNVQKGQEVVLYAELDQPEFVKMLTEECYRAGARRVSVEWNYQPLTKLHVRHQKVSTLGKIEKWEEERLRHYVDVIPCRIYLVSEDPDGLKGINLKKYTQCQNLRRAVIKPYRDALENKEQWCIAAVPGQAWAKKVFPSLSKKQAVEALWEAILSAARVVEGEDTLAAWKKHNDDLGRRCAYLNDLSIKQLIYKSENGTDLRVGMIPTAVFRGGADVSLQGYRFNPNIPTEECFISPMRGEAEGIVYSSYPLSYQGQVIDNFYLRFENGRVVDSHAEKNDALLKEMLATDEGAAYLGECALVPYHSPIRESNLLFYETLFDENASCHLALGMGYADTIRDFEKYTLEECRKMGINDSLIHVDFMIGTKDLSIDALTNDGQTVPIFRNGDWAF